MLRIIIDADPIVYRAAWAAESSNYVLLVAEDEDCPPDMVVFSPNENGSAGDQMREFLAENPDLLVVHKERTTEPQPLEHALHAAKSMIERTIATVKSRHEFKESGNVELQVLLSGEHNYRYELATVIPYKSSRLLQPRPHWYAAVREYLQEYWGARIVDGREADDECSILQRASLSAGHDAVICTVDKDLDQIPGYHYNYVSDVFYSVDDEEAEYLFWRQVLTGDKVDDICGAYRVGVVRAENALDGFLVDTSGTHLGSEAMWEMICTIYEQAIDDYGERCPYYEKWLSDGKNIEPTVLEMARLVKLQEYPNQLWNPPGVDDEWINVGINLDD